MNDKVKSVLTAILECFRSGNVPEAIAISMFPAADTPSSMWSLLNRTIMFLSGTADARGYRQWQSANRHVVKGAKAIHILVPFMKKAKDDLDGQGDGKTILRGFGVKPVFRVEDTDGEELDYQKIELPDLPLIEKAEAWGINVKAVPGNYRYYGFFSPENREIRLAKPEEKTFFHELAHVAHEKVIGTLKNGQHPLQEIVAELSAQALCEIVGKEQSDTLGNSYKYIDTYAQKLMMSPYSACLKVMSDTEKVLHLILNDEELGKVSSRVESPA